MLGDGNIRTKHNFPGFRSLVKCYFYRTLHSMDLVEKEDYSQPYLQKNIFRVALGALTTLSLLFTIRLFLYAANDIIIYRLLYYF